MREEEKLIFTIRKLLLDKTISDQKFVEEINQISPQIEQHFNFRSFRFFDYFNDEYYDVHRTPLQIIYHNTLQSILHSDKSNAEKRLQISRLLQTENPEIAKFQQETQDYYNDIWEAFGRISHFYYHSQEKPYQLNYWDQIINSSLLSQNCIDSLSPKLPRKLILDFAKLIQTLAEIDHHAVELIQNHIREAVHATAKEKIASIFELFKTLLILGKKSDSVKDEKKSERNSEIYSIQDQEYERIEAMEKRHIHYLYNFYVKNRDMQAQYQENAILDEPSKAFEELCHGLIYDKNFRYEPGQCGLTVSQLFFLKRDIHYLYVKDDLFKSRKKALNRLNRIATSLQSLATYCGCEMPIVAVKLPNRYSERESFFHKPYQVVTYPSPSSWENQVVNIELQKQRTHKLNIKEVANLLSGGLAVGEGTVAGMGNYQTLAPTYPALAAVSVIPTVAGSTGCNYAIVVKDTEDTLEILSGGLEKIHQDDNGKQISFTRKILIWFFGLLPDFISGACYGALGGLSTLATVSLVLGFFGVSLIPVIGWGIFAISALATIGTVFSMMFKSTNRTIASTTWADVLQYFNKRFYWPPLANLKERSAAFFYNFFSAIRLAGSITLVVGILFLTSLKLFAASLITAFAQFSWGGAVAQKVAISLSYVNSTLWLYFNFRKGSTLFDLLYPRGAAKIVPYLVESCARVIFLLPAFVCWVVKSVTWFYSSKTSARWKGYMKEFLDQTAPKWSAAFINKHLGGRTHSGIDEIPQDQQPAKLTEGLLKSIGALCRLGIYVPEVMVRLGFGLVYKVLWPVRKMARVIHNYTSKNSTSYRNFTQGRRFQESYMGEILVPKTTHWVSSKISSAAYWFRDKIHGWRNKALPLPVPVVAKAVDMSRKDIANTSSFAIYLNSLGQGETFAQGGAGQLPGFFQKMSQPTKDLIAGGPQSICSGALTTGACRTILDTQVNKPLVIVKKSSVASPGTQTVKKPPPPLGKRGSPAFFNTLRENSKETAKSVILNM